ncbi:choice-of-anchor D domain-containing protein [candidate division WOR-3 bacterium]|nr:choice-of-anchor D domain-containing protein [candidate division WOR-3 bacterium]
MFFVFMFSLFLNFDLGRGVVKTINAPQYPYGLAFDGQYLWLIGYNSGLIYKIDLSGGTPDIALGDSSIEFSQTVLSDTSYSTVSVFNNGTAELIIDNIQIQGDAFGVITSLPVSVLPLQNSAVEFFFSPDSYGHYQQIGYIHSNDPVDTLIELEFSGAGLYGQQHIELSAQSHAFGTVWVGGEGLTGWNLCLYNRGIIGLNIDSFSISPPFSVQSGSLPLEILPDSNSTVRVWFNPQATGNYWDTLEIYSDDPSIPISGVVLNGEGFSGNYSLGYMFWQYLVPDNPYTSYNDKKVEGLKKIGDVNGDGISDLVICTENYWTICINGASSGYADTFWTFNTGVDDNNTGSICLNGMFSAQKAVQPAEDLNGDGVDDVVICTDGGNEHVYALSGIDGEVIWSYGDDYNPYMGGFGAVDARRDFNGDGTVDVVAISSSNQDGNGYKSVFLFNGATGDSLWRYYVGVSGLSSGYSVVSLGDVTGDSTPDVAAGFGGDGTTQFVRGLDGSDGSFLWQFDGTTSGAKELLELQIEDSTSDVIAANYWEDIYRIDGETGSMVWHASIGSGYSGIIQMHIISDVNQNGYDDVIVANFSSLSGIFCLEGKDGSTLWFMPTQDYRSYGVVPVSDIDGDGIEEAVAGDQSGMLYIYSGGGDSLIYYSDLGNRIYTVENIGSIDGITGDEILVGLDDGSVFCFSTGEGATGVDENPPVTSNGFMVYQNFPDPFVFETHFAFSLPHESSMTVEIFNSAGQKVDEMKLNYNLSPGFHTVRYNGEMLPQGLYFYRLNAGGYFSETSKMIKIR